MRFCITIIFLFYLSGLLSQQPTRKDTLLNTIAENKGDSLNLDAYIEIIGWYYISDPDSAIYFSLQGFQFANRLDSEYAKSETCGWLAYLYEQKSMLPEAMQFNLLAMESYKKLGNLIGVATALNNLGLLYTRSGDYQKAFEFWDKSLEVSKEANYYTGIATIYGNIGFIRLEQGDSRQALEYMIKSAHYSELDSNFHGLGISYSNIGAIYSREKNYVQAIYYLEKSLAIQKRINDKVATTSSLSNLAFLYSEQGNYEKATAYYDMAFQICIETDKPDVMVAIYNNKAVIELKQNHPQNALELIEKAVSLSRKIGYPTLIRQSLKILIRTLNELNFYDKIEAPILEIFTLNNNSIRTNFSMLTEKEKELYFNSLTGDYQTFYSYTLFDQNKNPDLLDHVYNSTLQNKSFLLKSSTAMKTAILSSQDSLLTKQYENWLELKRQISQNFSSGTRDSTLEEKANLLERELVKKCSEFSNLTRIQELTWRDVQDNLKENEAAIEFIHFEHFFDTSSLEVYVVYCALVVKPGSEHPELIQLFNEADLKKIIGNFPGNNLSYIEQLYGTQSEHKPELYNLIWKPMEQTLNGVSTIYFSPTGLLHKISLSGLSKNKNIFLCDEHRLQLQSSTGQLAFPQSNALNKNSNLTIFGGIDYNTAETKKEFWTYLEGTKSETTQINNFLEKKNWRIDYLTGAMATEEQFKTRASESSVLHVATHGFFYPDPKEFETNKNESETIENDELNFRGSAFGYSRFVTNENPLMRSGIVFAGANNVWNYSASDQTGDGVLTAQEVAVLDLRKTDLVVLSACETGLGDIKGTEGVYGLQRAFKMAGVKYVIMSLWKVPDKETAEFMITFYRKLAKTKNVQSAFTETQTHLRSLYDPYYWAAFILLE